MKDMLWLIRRTLISTFKNYKNWLLYFGLPVAAILLALVTRGGDGDTRLNIGIVNQDGGQAITQDAVDFIGRMESVVLSEIGPAEVNDRIVSGELTAALTFPAGFAQSLSNGDPMPVQIVSIQDAGVTGYLKSNLSRYIDNRVAIADASEGDEARFEALYSAYRNSDFRFAAGTVEDRSVGHNRTNQSIGYLVILMLFAAANLSGILIRERENRTYFRVISSPISARTYAGSNIAVNLAVMIAQIAVTLTVLTGIFRVDPGIPVWTMFLILGLFALVAVSLSLALTALSKSSLAASASQNMLFLPTSILAGCMFPIDIMPAAMQNIAYFLPQYWLLDTFGELQLGNSLGSLYPNLLILAAFALTFSLVAVYKFGRNNDTRSYI